MLEVDKIIQHDAAKPFPLPDNCIDVGMTSPPYWGLRNYGEQVKSIFGGDPNCKHVFTEYHSKLVHENRQNLDGGTVGNDKFREKIHGFGKAKAGFCSKCGAWQGQLGLEPHPQMYIDHLVMICHEIKRVLKKSGSFYLNLGDTYGGSGRGYGSPPDPKWKKARGDNRPKPSKIYDGRWLQPKQLLLIPSRVAIALQNDGWILRNYIIWHKPNPMPSSVKDRLSNTWEPVFHFIQTRKYYYDLDAIREPHKTESLERAEYGFNVIPRAWKEGAIPVSGGKQCNIDCHPAGKNPGDVIGYNSKYNKGTHGQMPQGFTRVQSIAKERTQSREDAKILFPGDLKKQQEYINFIHDHGGDPRGKNPGDIIKIGTHHGSSLTKGRATHHEGQLIENYPSGKNPGDIIQFDEEYWWRFIIGKAHSNRFYKKAYDLMKNWMIKNNCFDYAIFYEWYKKEFKGKWESGTLEKGKADYLSDEKRLPFPKPETRFLGDGPSDFWDITTQPFTGYNPDLEHFAVFPDNLVLKPLLATCPKEICKKCGKPRTRIIKTDNPSKSEFNRDKLVKANEIQKTSNPQSIKSLHRNTSLDGKTKGVYYSGETVGWSDCGCNAGFESGVVLDPFAGRGTVGKVAKQLGLHYILFDIKPEYCELARLYIGGQKHKLAKDQSRLDV